MINKIIDVKIILTIAMILFFSVSNAQQDLDQDGIIDEKDSCPTIKGLEEYNGCPKPYKLDCKVIAAKDSLEIVKLKSNYKDLDKIYNQLSQKIFDPAKKYKLNKIRLYIYFIDWDIHCDLPGCCPDWRNIKSNYLIAEFWNKKALENLYNKKDINSIMFSAKFFPEILNELKEFTDVSLYGFLMKYYKKDSTRIEISKNNEENTTLVTAKLYFENPYKVTVSISGSNYFGQIDTQYEYTGKIWNIVNQ